MCVSFAATPKPTLVPGPNTQQGHDNHCPKAEWRLQGSPCQDGDWGSGSSLCPQLPGAHVLCRLEAAGGRVWDR